MVTRIVYGLSVLLPLVLAGIGRLTQVEAAIAVSLVAASGLLQWLMAQPSSEPREFWEPVIFLETGSILAVLVGTHTLGSVGFLGILPLLAHRNKVVEAATRPVLTSACLIFFAAWASSKGWTPGGSEAVQAAGAAVLGLIVAGQKAPVSIATAYVPAAFSPDPDVFQPLALEAENDESFGELRDAYRRLREAYRDLEVRSAHDRALRRLIDWRLTEERTVAGLSHIVREAIDVEGLCIYWIPDARDSLLLAGASGSAPSEVRSILAPVNASPIRIKDAVERTLQGVSARSGVRIATALLSDRGKLIGMAAIFDQDSSQRASGQRGLEVLAPFVAALLKDSREQQRLRDRVRQAELLEAISHRMVSAAPAEVANGLGQDIASTLELDGCVIFDLTGSTPTVIGGVGEAPVEILNLPGGQGIAGWLSSGGAELIVRDARDDERCDAPMALRRGVGSFVLSPLISSGSLIGAIASWTTRADGLSAVSLSTLRSLIPHVLKGVFSGFPSTKPGLVDSETFWEHTQGPGSFVEIDLGRSTGPASHELQIQRRKLLSASMNRLPQGGLITRREGGTLLVFLPGFDESAAARWADGLRPIAEPRWQMAVQPMNLSQQSRQFLTRLTA